MTSVSPFAATDSDVERLATIKKWSADAACYVSRLIGMLADPSWVVRRAVVDALGSAGEIAVSPLMDVLKYRRDNETRLAAAVDALVLSSAHVDASLLSLAHHPDPAVVADMVQILGRRKSFLSVATLASLTKHQDDNVAVGAIEALGRIGGMSAVEALLDIVAGSNFFRIFPAIDVLGRSGDPRAVGPLSQLLKNPSYLPEAARALGRSGEMSAVAPLVDLLKSQSEAVVRLASVSLAELHDRFEEKTGGNPERIVALIKSHVSSDTVRRVSRALPGADAVEGSAICKTLGFLGGPEAIATLTNALDCNEQVALSAALALKHADQQLTAHVGQSVREGGGVRRKALLPLVSRRADDVDVLECLSDSDAEIRSLACETLARIGSKESVPALFRLLSDSNKRVTMSAIAAIQSLGSREARGLAKASSKSNDPAVRRSALRILAYFGDAQGLDAMIESLQDPDHRVREAALQGLPFIDDSRAADELMRLSQSEDPKTRALALRSMGHLVKSTERAHSVLLGALSDADPWVRYYACQSAGRLKYTGASKNIESLLDDSAGQVRVAAVEALSLLNSPTADMALSRAADSEDLDVKRAALVGLGLAGRSEFLPKILLAAKSSDAPTRLIALSALVNYESPLVLDCLASAASDADEQVRATAINILSQRPEQEATEILVDLLGRELTRESAKKALLMAHPNRISGLLSALHTASDETAPLLVSVLSRIEKPHAKRALLAAMKLENASARKAAAVAIAPHRDAAVMAALQEASEHDPDPAVRTISALSLRD